MADAKTQGRAAAPPVRRGARERRRGVTLVELVVVLAVIGILAAGTGFALRNWSTSMRARGATRSIADLFQLARAESIRTGDNHIVFIDADVDGNPILDFDGATPVWAALVSDLNGDMQIDAGELRETVAEPPPGTALRFGRAAGRALVPRNAGALMGDPWAGTGLEGSAAELASPANFRDPTNNALIRPWVVFAPDGTPRSARPDGVGGTTLGAIGTGDGAVYVTNDEREYAVVLAPLGGIRLFQWDQAGNQWR